MPAPASAVRSIDVRHHDLRQTLQHQLLEQIPMAAAMQLSIRQWDGAQVEMHAPLAPNVNDKGCAFGGSLVSVMTLACWSLIKLAADERELRCEIYVQDSTVRYLAPVWEDFSAFAHLAEGQSIAAFLDALSTRGKARISTVCTIPLADGTPACTLEARFVAIRSKLPSDGVNGAQSEPAPRHGEAS